MERWKFYLLMMAIFVVGSLFIALIFGSEAGLIVFFAPLFFFYLIETLKSWRDQ